MKIREFFIVQSIILIFVIVIVSETKEVEAKITSGQTFELINKKYKCEARFE